MVAERRLTKETRRQGRLAGEKKEKGMAEKRGLQLTKREAERRLAGEKKR